MAKYKKSWGEKRVVKDPGSPGDDLRDVDWEEEDPRAMSDDDYLKHIKKKYGLMIRNMDVLKRVR